MGDDFPPDVKEFIRQNIHSLAQLEVLLALREEPSRCWTTDEITSRLYLQPQMVSGLLSDLVRRGFAVREDTGVRYQPANQVAAGLIERLAQLYHDRRVAVTTEIFSKPIDSLRAFADAFRLREKE
jgi:hypothetical protein